MTSPAQLAPCPRCGSTGAHGYVHTRHGNGGGDNRPCPNTPPAYTTDLGQVAAAARSLRTAGVNQ